MVNKIKNPKATKYPKNPVRPKVIPQGSKKATSKSKIIKRMATI